MGEYAEESIQRLIGEHGYMSPRQQRKQQRIREASLKEDRQIRAMIAKQEYCLDQLPDLDDHDDDD